MTYKLKHEGARCCDGYTLDRSLGGQSSDVDVADQLFGICCEYFIWPRRRMLRKLGPSEPQDIDMAYGQDKMVYAEEMPSPYSEFSTQTPRLPETQRTLDKITCLP